MVDNISVWCYSCSVREDLIFYKKITGFTVEKGRRRLNQILYFLVTWHNEALRKQYKAGEGSVTASRYTAWDSEDPSSTSPSDPVQETTPLPPKMLLFLWAPKCLGHLLSLWAHKVPPIQTWRLERHVHHPQSQNSATLHTKTQEPVSLNTICYRGGQHLLDCWSTITENSKWAPFIVWLASASWQSWQPTAHWWRLRNVRDQPPHVSFNTFRSHSMLWFCLLPHVAE